MDWTTGRWARTALAGALVIGAGAATAQDRRTPAPAPARSGGTAAPPASPPPAAATEPASPPPQPVRTEILAHENWTTTCRDFADRRRVCTANLQVVQGQTGQVLFGWLVGRDPDNKLVNVLQTPTGILIGPGVEVKIGSGSTRRAAFVNCDASRCEATLPADDPFIREASGADNVDATVVSTAGQSVKFTLPFKGFDKAVAALR